MTTKKKRTLSVSEPEYQKISPYDIKKVKELTDKNQHTAARYYVAKEIFKITSLSRKYAAIQTLQDVEGYLPKHLDLYRDTVDEDLKRYGMIMYGPNFKAIEAVL